ncbi:MAG: hypothetical protein Q9227_002912 [Pyrenula ochraceoflavens]
MDNNVGGDIVNAPKQVEDEAEKGNLREGEQQGFTEIAAEKEAGLNRSSSSSQSSSEEEKDLKKYDSEIVKIRDTPEGDEAFAHLPDHEKNVLKKQLDSPTVQVSYKTLYRYATTWDMIIVVVSSISAIAAGAALPLMTVVFGNLTGTLQGSALGQFDYSSFNDKLVTYVLYFIYIAIAEFFTTYAANVGFMYTGEHITQKIREQYLKAILRQNIGFFDKLGAGEVTTRITADTNLIQDGLSEKIGLTLTGISTFITAFIIGFIKFWKLTLICTSTVVAIVVTMGGGSRFITAWGRKNLAAYAKGGTVAEEVLGSIRNAQAFGTQDKLAKSYDEHLVEARIWGTKFKALLGVMIGFMLCFVFLNYGLAFWMGSRFIVDGETNLSHIITIILAIMMGAFSLGNVAPNSQAFTQALSAASKIFSTIDRVSPLDPDSKTGDKLDHVEGKVELRHIKHIYPSRAEVVVMQDVNLVVHAGKTTALVGASGSGKSTIVGLVERFYDPVGGQVFLDDHDISTLNLRWLRQNISLVSQEPTLFATTIEGNIGFGLIGSKFENESGEARKNRIIQAAKMANAHDFVEKLPEGYETNVGERGFLLSGGQKQRIAIARAIASDPKILLLDEATSALDTKSEGVVQAALDKAAEGRTTIVIAHRLSTIKHADNIVVMQEGRIVEQGKHDELLERKAAYYNLVQAQRINDQVKENAPEEDEKAMEVEAQLEKAVSKASGVQKAPSEDDVPQMIRTTTTKSVSSVQLSKKPNQKQKQYPLLTLVRLTLGFNKPEWKLMVLGLFFSIIGGGGQPTQAVFFAKCILALTVPPALYGQMRSDINFWCLMYLMLGLVTLLAQCISGVSFAICSEKLIHRARDRAFRNMLRQDISFFDKDENATGVLTSFLSTETTHLASISGATLGTILSCITTLAAALIISLAIGWKLALVVTSTIPVLLACGFLRFWMLARFQQRSKKAYEGSAAYACESTNAIRTVASLTREADVWEQYHSQLVAQGKKSLRSVAGSSSLYAASQSLMFLCVALGFWYGGRLIGRGEYNIFQFFICFSEIIFGAQSAGTVFSFAGDMGKAKNSAAALKRLFDSTPTIDTWSNDGAKVDSADGAIEFRDVHFRYPTRPEQPVLRGLSLDVKPGQYVALVGASGCGKSTTIALLERFYDPLAGGIYLDGREISSLNLNEYRTHLALVSQEPTLYQGTIRENVLMGADRPDVSDEEIIRACKDANIYDFIMSLPDAFHTQLGPKATLLSGGQKQRVAIARALLRNPKVLLLDEATSALDSESEKVVQEALDRAARGRTTIAVAHRLSTIQRADCIYVFEGGKIVEWGTHEELMNVRKSMRADGDRKIVGRYRELVSLQSLEAGK